MSELGLPNAGQTYEIGKIIGRVTSSKEQPSSANSFYFWVRDDVLVNLFDFVSVENIRETRTIGVIKDLMYPTDADSHLSNYVSSDFGDVNAQLASNTIGSCVAKVDVLGNTGIESSLVRRGRMQLWYPPKNFSHVRFATPDEIDFALGIPEIDESDKVPAGFIVNSNGFIKPIFFNRKYLLGPEAGHINVSGISGLATKTSYILFLLWVIFKKFRNDVCAILFNVKQRDLLYIDEPPTDLDLEEIDYKLYSELGFSKLSPFENVVYLFPKRKRRLNSIYETSKHNIKEYAFTFTDVHDEIDLLFSEVRDPNYTMASICEWLKSDEALRSIKNWSILRNFEDFPSEVVGGDKNVTSARNVRFKFKKEINRLTSDKDIFVDNRSVNDVYLGKFIADSLSSGRGQVFVVDIQPFEKNIGIQGFIVGDVINRLLQKITELPQESRPKHIIIFIDELNRYVPNRAGEPSALASTIIELARVGRAEGLTLFGAEQFMSEIDHQVYENCATNVIGRTGATELSKQAYDFLDKETKTMATRLQPGEMIVANPLFGQPLKVIFPKPPIRRQTT